jgi:hypothetical protein
VSDPRILELVRKPGPGRGPLIHAQRPILNLNHQLWQWYRDQAMVQRRCRQQVVAGEENRWVAHASTSGDEHSRAPQQTHYSDRFGTPRVAQDLRWPKKGNEEVGVIGKPTQIPHG